MRHTLACGLVLSLYSLMLGVYLDGWPGPRPLTLDAFVAHSDNLSWHYRPLSWFVPFLWFGILCPLTRTSWWEAERRRWATVAAVLLDGTVFCPCRRCDPTGAVRAQTANRYGFLIGALGALLILGSCLQQHARVATMPDTAMEHSAALSWSLSGLLELRLAPALSMLTGGAIIAIGIGTTGMWASTTARVWSARLAMLLLFASFFASLGEHDLVNRLALKAGAIAAFREEVLAVVTLTASTLGYMLVGWCFAERSR